MVFGLLELKSVVRLPCPPSHVRFEVPLHPRLLVFYGETTPSLSAPSPSTSGQSLNPPAPLDNGLTQLCALAYNVLSVPKLCPSWLLDRLIPLIVQRQPTYQFLCIDIPLFLVRINLFFYGFILCYR